MRSLLGSICWVASAGCLLMACASETPPDRVSPSPPPPRTVTLTPNAQTLAAGQTVTLRATVSGNDKPVLVWSPHCERSKEEQPGFSRRRAGGGRVAGPKKRGETRAGGALGGCSRR
jgi:hypothetical protein